MTLRADAGTLTTIDRAGRTRRLERLRRIDEPTSALLWEIYSESFAHLRERALLTHCFERGDFEDMMRDPRIDKVVAFQGDRPVGMGVITNHLELAPQISPAFLRRLYPALAARNAIYVGILVFVASDVRKRSLFSQLVTGMGQLAALAHGVAVFDVCDYNREEHRVDSQIEHMSTWFTDARFSKIDSQTFFAIELPTPAERLPFGVVESICGDADEDVVVDLTG